MADQHCSKNLNPLGTSPEWIKPNDLMKSKKLKVRRHALKTRLTRSEYPFPKRNVKKNFWGHCEDGQTDGLASEVVTRQKNPFKHRYLPSKTILEAESSGSSEDFTIFNLHTQKYLKENVPNSCTPFQDLAQIQEKNTEKAESDNWSHTLLVDWSLKSKIRFCSPRPLPWKHTFKTSEEAAGTTGFVRCLTHETNLQRTLDTSSNAQLYERCLVWVHPCLPGITLFPRDKEKVSAPSGIYGSDPKIKDALHSEWSKSMVSLFQLIRVRQCAFFYVCAKSFTCLFRAAGTSGFTHTHALISPTTRGFRHALKTEGVEFTMPLNKKVEEAEDLDEEVAQEEGACEALETSIDETEEETSTFLAAIGLETSQFPGLNQSRAKTETKKFKNVDGLAESLVYVEDMELHSLINFLLNCGSCTSTTGALAGVPPTLLSPVGFHGGTLKSLNIKRGTFRTRSGETQHSVDIEGPILPTCVLRLCNLFASSVDSFSASPFSVSSTLPFCSVSPLGNHASMPMAFASEGLVDCGLGKDIREIICTSPHQVQESGLPSSCRELKCKNGKFTWSNKI